MSFYNFPGFTSPADTSFHPLFRLLDDFDNYSQGNISRRNHRSQIKTFNPKFDVKEVGSNYELHGELPGVDQKDIEIEFTDDHTLTIKGHSERSYQSGTPPAGFVEGPTAAGALPAAENGHDAHKATVETVPDESDTVATKESTATEVAKKDPEQPKEPQTKYWVSERSIGEFSRTFSFPVRVDTDAVQASMKNGILSIIVPKAQKKETRKININ
ncbi:HSP20-like chaperone [Acephala macrosclerotiorum]|nr:HSP20-like chaperone [Acephala macrosclerotiorum]